MKKNLILQFLLFLIVFSVLIYLYFITKETFKDFIDFKSQLSFDDAKINIKDFKLDETDGNILSWSLSSEKASLYEINDLINLNNNKLLVYNDNQIYEIKSDFGVYNINNKLLKLSSNVEFKTANDFVFFTEELFYNFENKTAETNKEIQAKDFSKNIEIKGKNFFADIENKNFIISKDVFMQSYNDDLNIKSNRVNFFTKSNKVSFFDNVRTIKKDISIFCNKMDVYYNKEGFKEMHAFNKVRITIDNDKKAYAKFAIINDERIVLREDASFLTNDDEFKGAEIIYKLLSKDIVINEVKGFINNIKVNKQ